MNSVAKDVLKLWEQGAFTRETAHRLLRDLQKGVHWCDGNEYEAVECLYDHRCGRCLEESSELSDAFRALGDLAYQQEEAVWDYGLTPQLCPSCLEELRAQLVH